jgi:hypothetical protein
MAASQPIDGDEDRGSFKHFHQPVEQPFIVVMCWLEIFFENLLGFPDGLNRQFLIAHCLALQSIEPPFQFRSPNLVPLRGISTIIKTTHGTRQSTAKLSANRAPAGAFSKAIKIN